jgi:hypothetical protein
MDTMAVLNFKCKQMQSVPEVETTEVTKMFQRTLNPKEYRYSNKKNRTNPVHESCNCQLFLLALLLDSNGAHFYLHFSV